MKTTLAGEFSSLGGGSGSWLHHRLLKHVDLFIAISHDILSEYRTKSDLPASRIELVPNGVDLELYRPISPHDRQELRETLGLPNTPILIYHGVFMERKSIDWLIEAITDLLIERKIVLLLIGDACRDEPTTGYYRDLIAQTQDLSASGAVIFKGFQKDVYRYLQACDAYILPSTEEGLSNSLLEAMAVGLLPIVSRTSGTEELLKDKVNGLTFAPRKNVELRDAVGWYLSIYGTDTERSLRAAARETIERNYSIHETAKRYSSLYRRLAGHTR